MLYCNWCMIKLVLILIFFIIINVFCYDWCIIKLILIDDGPMQIAKEMFFRLQFESLSSHKKCYYRIIKEKNYEKKKKKSHAFIIAPPNTEAQQVNSRQSSLSALIKNGHQSTCSVSLTHTHNVFV